MFRALLICLVLLSCLVHAENVDLDALLKHAENVGADALLKHVENVDLETLMRDAQQGDSEAQFVLGFMYYYGKGIPKDNSEAVRWLRKAAEQGYAWAQTVLGQTYHRGIEGVVPRDHAEAVRWYRKAAEQGHALAQQQLGYTYLFGEGIPQDYSEAVRWYRKAAEQGNVWAQTELGHFYREGVEGVVPRDDAEALHWYLKAAEQGHALAQQVLASAIAQGDYSPEVLDASVVCTDEDREKAAFWGHDPEDAYKFGQTIKQLVADRDLTGLFELVPDELQYGPRKKFIENKTFDQVFSESWRSTILASVSPCSPFGRHGFTLAHGLWYRFDPDPPAGEGHASPVRIWLSRLAQKLVAIDQGEGHAPLAPSSLDPPGTWYIERIHWALEEKYMDAPSDPAWRVDGEVIPPECFIEEWMSGDNFEEYADTYGIEDYGDFAKYPGKYFGREIDRIGPIIARSWIEEEEVHLATVPGDCPIGQWHGGVKPLSIDANIIGDADYVSRARCTGYRCLSDAYRLLTPLSQAECQSLAPHLPGQCESAYLVETVEETGGRGIFAVEIHYNFYGLFNLEDGRKAIVPLVNFRKENHARNFLDELRARH